MKWTRWLPGLVTLREYQAEWLRHDIVAGLVLATMLVPVGIAYAVASGVPGIYGLYATIVPLLAYALFGPSRILVLGPDSSLAPLILGVVFPLSGGDPVRAVALASMMAIVSGVVCIVAGLARLGFITELALQAHPLRIHERNSAYGANQPTAQAFRLLDRRRWTIERAMGDSASDFERKSQLDSICGWRGHVGGHSCTEEQHARARNINCSARRDTQSLVYWILAARANLSVLGPLPQGLPTFTIPWISYADIGPVLIGGLAVALVSFADTSVLSRVYAARTRTNVDPNQEMVGLGAANLAAGFFQGFPISSSSSRTPVAEAAGARTQLTGVVGALSVALLLLVAPNLLQNLPSAALAAVVIASAIGLFEITDLIRIFRIQPWEFWLSIVCFLGVAVFGAIPGIGLAVVIAIIEFLWDGWRPHSAVLGRPKER